MEGAISAIISTARSFKDGILLPLSKEGVLSEDFLKMAIEEYIRELKDRETRIVFQDITRDGPLSPLHPFYMASFTIDGKEYKSVEHYYQAASFFNINEGFAAQIMDAPSAEVAHRRSINAVQAHQQRRPDWDGIKCLELEKAYRALFAQHPNVFQVLKSTDDARLRYSHQTDTFLGWQSENSGQNVLGELLTKLKQTKNK